MQPPTPPYSTVRGGHVGPEPGPRSVPCQPEPRRPLGVTQECFSHAAARQGGDDSDGPSGRDEFLVFITLAVGTIYKFI